MNVFITGGTGFVGTAVIRELLAAGHRITGLARNDAAVDKLRAASVTPLRGDLADTAGLTAAAKAADATIHCGFIHDFSNFAASVATDARAVAALIEGVAASRGSQVFVSTSGTALLKHGRMNTEHESYDPGSPLAHRGKTDQAVRDAASRGIRSAVLRLPPSVHGPETHGFVPMLMEIARKTGVSAYIGEGANRWPAVHRDDAAALYRLAIENLADGSVPAGSALHAVHDTGVPFREIAQAIADQLKLGPAQSRPPEHFGWMAGFASIDNPMSSEITRQQTGWRPTRVGLLEDIRSSTYAR